MLNYYFKVEKFGEFEDIFWLGASEDNKTDRHRLVCCTESSDHLHFNIVGNQFILEVVVGDFCGYAFEDYFKLAISGNGMSMKTDIICQKYFLDLTELSDIRIFQVNFTIGRRFSAYTNRVGVRVLKD